MPGGFGGSYDTNTTIVENPIGKALFERILRAHKVKKNVAYVLSFEVAIFQYSACDVWYGNFTQ